MRLAALGGMLTAGGLLTLLGTAGFVLLGSSPPIYSTQDLLTLAAVAVLGGILLQLNGGSRRTPSRR